MNELLSFLAALVGSLLDPVLMAGCVLAGWYLRPQWTAVAVAVMWNVLIYAIMLKLAFKEESHARFFISGAQYLGSSAAAISAALLAYRLGAREQQNSAERREHGPPAAQWRVAWSLGSLLALAAFLTGWVCYASLVLNHFHDLNGPAYYWERANLTKHYWATELSSHAGVAAAGMGIVWALYLAKVRPWPRSTLFLLATYLYLEFLFWIVVRWL